MHDDLKTIVLSLRGTHSVKDALVDIAVELVAYKNCDKCRIHKGFSISLAHTWSAISETLFNALSFHTDYQLMVMGHSLGGAVALLLTLKLVELNWIDIDNLHCITMGQPIIGNSFFATYVNERFLLNTKFPFETGKLLRVTHKNDPIVRLPSFMNYFVHSKNEVFINDMDNIKPDLHSVMYCEGNEDPNCAYGDDNFESNQHLNYFKKLGSCGMSFDSSQEFPK